MGQRGNCEYYCSAHNRADLNNKIMHAELHINADYIMYLNDTFSVNNVFLHQIYF